MKWLMRSLGYLLFGAVAFLMFLYWTFPFDRLQSQLSAMLQQTVGPSVKVSIGHLSPNWFTGVVVENLKLTAIPLADAPANAATRADAVLFDAPRVYARLHLMRLLFGEKYAGFRAELTHGTLEGSVTITDDGPHLALELDHVALTPLFTYYQVKQVQFSGAVSGTVDLLLNLRQPKMMQGNGELTWHEWKLLKGSPLLTDAASKLGLPIGDADLILTGKKGSGLKFQIEKGTAAITSLRCADGDIGVDLTGQWYLDQPLTNSRLNLKGTAVVGQRLAAQLPLKDGDPIEMSGRLNRMQLKLGTLPPFPIEF